MRTFDKPTVAPSARGLEAKFYLSEDVFETERAQIFARSWIAVGRFERLAEPGDFFLCDVAGASLILTRDRNGAPHAFYNVCRHRGSRLCTESAGRFAGSIVCPYHAWTYDLDGRLAVARNAESTPAFDPSSYPLTEAQVATFGGFLFVNLDAAAPDLAGAFAPLYERFEPWNLAALRAAHRIDYDVQCNWKLVFLNYSECYHCPVIHPQLEKLSASDSGRNDLTVGPFLGGYSTYRTPNGSLTASGVRSHSALPGVRGDELGRVYYYTLFPSLLISLHPDYAMVHYVEPLEPGRTRVTCEWFFDPVMLESGTVDPDDAVQFWDLTNRQDWRINELTQLGIASPGYVPGPYLQQEGLLAAFDRHYLNRLQLAPKGIPDAH